MSAKLLDVICTLAVVAVIAFSTFVMSPNPNVIVSTSTDAAVVPLSDITATPRGLTICMLKPYTAKRKVAISTILEISSKCFLFIAVSSLL